MKWKAIIIILIILVSLFPVYLINKYLQRIIKPRNSLGQLFLYLLSGLVLIFGYTFLLVLIIKKLFPGA
jgi:hypothetical protein